MDIATFSFCRMDRLDFLFLESSHSHSSAYKLFFFFFGSNTKRRKRRSFLLYTSASPLAYLSSTCGCKMRDGCAWGLHLLDLTAAAAIPSLV